MAEVNRGFEKMDPEEYRQRKRQERSDVFDMLSQSTQSLLKPEELQQYLDLQSRFLQFSVSNVLLIKAQNPEATWLRTFDEWKSDNVSLLRGETGIMAMESSYYQKQDGSMGRSMKVARLFDISQTNAANRQITRPSYKGVPGYINEVSGNRVQISEHLPEGIDGMWDRESGQISIRPDLSPDREFFVTAREVCAMELAGENASREEVLPYAECAAYMLSRRYGLEADKPDLQKLTEHYPGMEEKEVRAELSQMKNTAAVMDARLMEARYRDREAKEAER